MKDESDKLFEMHVKFWEPYAKRMAAKGVDVIERALTWLPKINGMTIEHVSSVEVLLHNVPGDRILRIREAVKGGVVDEFGWAEEPSCVVSVGVCPR